jgi:hypothetical protein
VYVAPTVQTQSGTNRAPGAHRDRQARIQRDDALRRSGSITRAIAAASLAALAALGVYVSRAFPGHSASTTVPSPGATSTGGASTNGAVAGGGTSTGGQSGTSISPPTNAPAPSQQQAPVVSGSS